MPDVTITMSARHAATAIIALMQFVEELGDRVEEVDEPSPATEKICDEAMDTLRAVAQGMGIETDQLAKLLATAAEHRKITLERARKGFGG